MIEAQGIVNVRLKNGARLPPSVDVEKAEQRTTELHRKHGGLTAEIVLGDGANPDSPLHGVFEWSDKKAAHEYRLEQARRFLRSIEVTIIEPDGTQTPVRRFIYSHEITTREEEAPGQYIAIENVLSSDEMCSKQADLAVKELRQWVAKWAFVRSYLDPIYSIIQDASKEE